MYNIKCRCLGPCEHKKSVNLDDFIDDLISSDLNTRKSELCKNVKKMLFTKVENDFQKIILNIIQKMF